MSRPSLMLTEREVPLASRAHIYLPSDDTPDGEAGTPHVFLKLMGGVPMREKMYAVRGDELNGGYENFKEGVLFSPAEVYNSQNAPVGLRYATFSGGKRMLHRPKEGFEHFYEAVRGTDKLFVSCGFPFQSIGMAGIPAFEFDMKRYEMFPDEQLVTIIKRGQEQISLLRDPQRYVLDEATLKRWTSETQREINMALEAFGRKHRDSSGILELIRLLEQNGSQYLNEFSALDDIQLVPVEGIRSLHKS